MKKCTTMHNTIVEQQNSFKNQLYKISNFAYINPDAAAMSIQIFLLLSSHFHGATVHRTIVYKLEDKSDRYMLKNHSNEIWSRLKKKMRRHLYAYFT